MIATRSQNIRVKANGMTIELRGVAFSYANDATKLLLNIDHWSIARGERVLVHGPSGAGKSTLLNLLGGLLTCTLGEVALLGTRIDAMNARQRDRFRANHVGYVFQRFNLVPYLNAIENIELASTFAAGKVRSSVRNESTDLLHSLNVIPSDWSKPTSHLSMGQQQRVAIARALINAPEILIADEPTSSLDAENRDNFLSLLLGLVAEKNTTLVFVSHDLAIAPYFTRVQALSEFNKGHC